jgi:2-dehydro-3-deoxyphosphogluconate aldolase/(4S)-4-hydroxy-2-oxoglutarate aldolase
VTKAEVVGALEAGGIIPVIRAGSHESAIRIAEALVAGGIRTLEVTMTVPDALLALHAIADRLGRDVLLGAGTVTNRRQAEEAVDAGARFLVSPCVVEDVIVVARERKVAVLPGALTPTEVFAAHALGAA